MLGLITLRLEIEVMIEGMVTTFTYSGEHNGHIKLSPTLFIDAERRLLKYYNVVSTSLLPIGPDTRTLLVLLE